VTTALVSAFQPDAVDGRSRLVEGVVEVVAKTRTHPLMRKIIELDPEFLTPYLLERARQQHGRAPRPGRGRYPGRQEDGSIRAGDADWLSRQINPGVAGIGRVRSGACRGRRVSEARRGTASDAHQVLGAMISVGNASLNAARRTRELDWLDTTGQVDVL